MQIRKYILVVSALLLPVIIFSQFAGTSLWFVGNAIIDAIQKESATAHADITSVVQFGFIAGTLVFSVLTIADRFNPSKVFFFSSLIAAASNILIIWFANDAFLFPAMRFITGFFLAGIYPVGMKIAADLFPQKLGRALGYLVGALVLGTAFPHLLRSQLQLADWKLVVVFTSSIAFIGGLLILLTIPKTQKKISFQKIQWRTSIHVFQNRSFRSAAFGYFGHMWELYAFWASLPVMILLYNNYNAEQLNVSFWSFAVIAVGSIGCVAGGYLSQKWGSKKVSFYALLLSGICCVAAPFVFHLPPQIFVLFFLFWGMMVVADSPQFSSLVAQNANEKVKGTALTIVTCIGFAITIFSIQILKTLVARYSVNAILLLALGPLFGLLALIKRKT